MHIFPSPVHFQRNPGGSRPKNDQDNIANFDFSSPECGNVLRRKAFAVRQEFERHTVDRTVLKKLYSEYATVPDLDAFLTRAREIFPQGNCGLASLYLKHQLGCGTVVSGFYKDEPHTFLSLPNGWIADITADQFDGPAVYVGELKRPWRLP